MLQRRCVLVCIAVGIMAKNTLLNFGVMTAMGLTLVAGGSSLPAHENFLLIAILNLGLLAAALWYLRDTPLPPLAVQGLFLIGCTVSLMSLQLLPLPPSVWSNLAGRHFISDIFAQASLINVWMPLSMSPSGTAVSILALLPGISAFAFALATQEQGHVITALLIIAIATMNIAVGFSQEPKAAGFFINQNFYAAFLYSSIGSVFFLGHTFATHSKWSIPIAGVAALLLMTAIGATGSRLGLMIAAALLAVHILLILKFARTSSSHIIALTLLIICTLMLGGLGLSRLTELQSALEFRSSLFSTGVKAATTFFPVGSGFGTFVPVYQLFETPDSIQPYFINHAHNDWLELVIEGGLPVLILYAAFIWWFAKATHHAWAGTKPKICARFASLTIAGLLLHSCFDYPLRTASLMCIFGWCCGVLASAKGRQTARDAILRKTERVFQ